MPLVYYLQIHNLAIMLPGHPSRRVARNGFVNNKQMAFLQIFVSQQLFFSFSKHLYTMSNVTDCDPSQTNLCYYYKQSKKKPLATTSFIFVNASKQQERLGGLMFSIIPWFILSSGYSSKNTVRHGNFYQRGREFFNTQSQWLFKVGS